MLNATSEPTGSGRSRGPFEMDSTGQNRLAPIMLIDSPQLLVKSYGRHYLSLLLSVHYVYCIHVPYVPFVHRVSRRLARKNMSMKRTSTAHRQRT